MSDTGVLVVPDICVPPDFSVNQPTNVYPVLVGVLGVPSSVLYIFSTVCFLLSVSPFAM